MPRGKQTSDISIPRQGPAHTQRELLGEWGRLTVSVQSGDPSSVLLGFPGGSDGKESTCNAGDPGLIPGLGRSPGEGNGYPFQYSCLGIPMDREAWRATVQGIAESQHN